MSRRVRRSPALPLIFCLGALILAGRLASHRVIAAQDAQATSEKFTDAMDKGTAAIRTRRFQHALEAFREANALMGKKSAAALLGVSQAFHGLEAYKSEADTCADALKFVGDNPKLAGALHSQRGLGLFSLASTTKNAKLWPEAEAEFRSAFALPEPGPLVEYNLGVTLLKQNRDEEGLAVLRHFVATGRSAPELTEARKLIDNPRRARVPYAPDFSLTTLSGEFVTLEELHGKVVLLDFWGTWCPPCVAATPSLVGLYKKHSTSTAGNGKFEMIGVSSDPKSEEGKVRGYVDTNKMLWPQHLDATRQAQRLFAVTAYPTYIVLDADGVVRERFSGWNPADGTSRLDSAIKRLLKEIPLVAPLPTKP